MNEELEDCSICLQPYLHPVQLSCKHVFCFLCAKGCYFKNSRCALCRSLISPDFLQNPTNYIKSQSESEPDVSSEQEYCWFYEGRSGWWMYDKRSNDQIEEFYSQDSTGSHQLLIAGHMYTIDFQRMVQFRTVGLLKYRSIKRDKKASDKKGVAGLIDSNK